MTTMTMTDTKKTTTKAGIRKRRKPSKPIGARALLLTLALGGTLGGWAGLAFSAMRTENAALPSTPQPDPALEAVVVIDPAADAALQLPPIPTIQPPPAAWNEGASAAIQTIPAPATLAPIPAVPQPVIQRPVTRTRSSR